MVAASRSLEQAVSSYHRILLAVDLTEESSPVAARAHALAASEGASVHLVHVIEPLNFAYSGDVPLDISTVQDQIHDQARHHLQEFANRHQIDADHTHLLFGRPDSEIQRLAEEIEADIIVVGSHGRHGLALLLGSTANGVLHGARCDVLAVRVGPDVPFEG